MKVLTVDGMMCQHCAMRVTKALQAVEGVSSVVVDLPSKTVSVETTVSDEVLTDTITKAGYTVKGIKNN